MATIIERMMLVNLDGHVSQGGLDLFRYSIRNSKGLAGALRRNKMIPLISQMDAFCDEILREIPGYASATKCESFCIHCMQDHRVGVRTPTFGDNHSDTVFLMQANNCDYTTGFTEDQTPRKESCSVADRSHLRRIDCGLPVRNGYRSLSCMWTRCCLVIV